jgi:hypothetical protein
MLNTNDLAVEAVEPTGSYQINKGPVIVVPEGENGEAHLKAELRRLGITTWQPTIRGRELRSTQEVAEALANGEFVQVDTIVKPGSLA